MRNRSAFTLVELLVVIAIIALLLSILVPSLSRARMLTIRMLCVNQTRVIDQGCHSYAAENHDFFPYRPAGNYLPHAVYVANSFDLNASFIQSYLTLREKVMFCPGSLYQVRNPSVMGWSGNDKYGYTWVTYMYFNFRPTHGTFLTADGTFPKLIGSSTSDPRYPLWGCLTVDKHYAWLAHDSPENQDVPLGMSACFVDGSARWVPWSDMETFWTDGTQNYYWPTPTWENETHN